MNSIAVQSHLELWAFRLLARYLRRAPLNFGQWRLRLFGVSQARRLAPQLGRRVVTTRYGFRMELDLRDWGDQFIYVTGDYEDYTTTTIRALLQPGDVVVDVGANAGFFSLLASTMVGPDGEVLAFEPVPLVRERLLANLKLNGIANAVVRPVALNDAAGKITIFSSSCDNTGLSSFRRLDAAATEIEIEAVRWDKEVSPEKNVRLIKIDVEGAECRVLRGMGDYLDRAGLHRPDLVIEVSSSYLMELGDSAQDLCQQLTRRGYRMFAIRWDGLVPLDGWNRNLPNQFNALFTTRASLPSKLNIIHEKGAICR
jgi:FkbM family methyltransferase